MNRFVSPMKPPKRENALIPSVGQRTDLLHDAIEEINRFYDAIDDLRVRPQVGSTEIRAYLQQFDFAQPTPDDATELVADIAERLKSWSLHTPHPRYFGLFNPASNVFGMAADLLVAGLNPQLGAWHHNPFGVEVEAHLIRFFASRFGLGDAAFGNFTSGGSEANFSAVVVALSRVFPSFARTGVRGLSGEPVFYCSAEFHHSFVKIAHQCGLGRNAVRRVPVTPGCVMNVDRLEELIARDRRHGRIPFMVVATAGTTNAGLVEPLHEIGAVARRDGLHFHVDAAWGGGVILSDKYRSELNGIETADTITFDPHKLLSVPMGAGMFLVREKSWLYDAFGLQTDYVPQSPTDNFDNYQISFQFSRRFIGLKLFMTLAALGREGLARTIDGQFDLAKMLAGKLEDAGFQVVNGASLGVVCFVPPAEWQFETHGQFEELVERVCQTGRAWISTTKFGGRSVFRACITSHLTRICDLDELVSLVSSAKR